MNPTYEAMHAWCNELSRGDFRGVPVVVIVHE